VSEKPAEKLRSFVVGWLGFSWVNAAAVVLAFELLLALGFAAPVALPATLLFMLGSSVLVYMQTAQENSLMLLCFLGALVFGVRARQARPGRNLALSGAFAGAALLVKITNLAFLPALGLLCAAGELERRRAAGAQGRGPGAWVSAGVFVALRMGPPLLVALAADRAYHSFRFGDWLGTYAGEIARRYAALGGFPPGYPFDHDPLAGFLGPFVAPHKSILLFEPSLWLLIALLVFAPGAFGRATKQVLAAAALVLLLLALAFAGSRWWNGESAWGPRHHLVPVQVMCLLAFAQATRMLPELRPWLRGLVLANVALALLVQAVAIPKRVDIEVAQLAYGDPVRVLPLMRMRNLAHLALGDFEARGLHHGDPNLLAAATSSTAGSVFAFRLGPYLPAPARAALVVLWSLLASATAVALAALVLPALRGRRVR
jgi:hypothetical protein